MDMIRTERCSRLRECSDIARADQPGINLYTGEVNIMGRAGCRLLRGRTARSVMVRWTALRMKSKLETESDYRYLEYEMRISASLSHKIDRPYNDVRRYHQYFR